MSTLKCRRATTPANHVTTTMKTTGNGAEFSIETAEAYSLAACGNDVGENMITDGKNTKPRKRANDAWHSAVAKLVIATSHGDGRLGVVGRPVGP